MIRVHDPSSTATHTSTDDTPHKFPKGSGHKPSNTCKDRVGTLDNRIMRSIGIFILVRGLEGCGCMVHRDGEKGAHRCQYAGDGAGLEGAAA